MGWRHLSQGPVFLPVFPESHLFTPAFSLISFLPSPALDCLLAGWLGKEVTPLPRPLNLFTCEFQLTLGHPNVDCMVEGPCLTLLWGTAVSCRALGPLQCLLSGNGYKESLGKGEPANPGRVEFQEWRVSSSSLV